MWLNETQCDFAKWTFKKKRMNASKRMHDLMSVWGVHDLFDAVYLVASVFFIYMAFFGVFLFFIISKGRSSYVTIGQPNTPEESPKRRFLSYQ